LDPNVHGGRIYSDSVRRPHDGNEVRLWLRKDARQIAERRSDVNKRKEAPGEQGEWIMEDLIFQKSDGRLFCTDPKLLADAEAAGDPLDSRTPQKWRRKKQKALDGRAMESFRAPRANRPTPRANRLIVSSKQDFKTMTFLGARAHQRAVHRQRIRSLPGRAAHRPDIAACPGGF
jgi:hypothetical protein